MKCKFRHGWFIIDAEDKIMTRHDDWLMPMEAAKHYSELVRNGSPLRVLAELKNTCRDKRRSRDSLLRLRQIHLPTATELWPSCLKDSPFSMLRLILWEDNQLLAANFAADKSYQIRI